MAGATPTSQLISRGQSRVTFTVATEADDDEIRRLLRENPMEGEVVLSLEREPSYFADTVHLHEKRRTIIARQSGRVVCLGNCSIRNRYLNGKPCRVGYLGGLRLDATCAGRFDLLRRGYRFFHALEETDPADFYFTSIASGNERAIRFLERGLPGMPKYSFLSEYVTLLIPVPRSSNALRKSLLNAQRNLGNGGLSLTPGNKADTGKLCDWMNKCGRLSQLTPCWMVEELEALQRLGLAWNDFQVVEKGSSFVGCAALWDQRSYKQTVVHGYGSKLAFAKPWVNMIACLVGRPRLAEIGTALDQAYVSHLYSDEAHPEVLVAMIRALFTTAKEKGVEYLTMGFVRNDPRLQTIVNHFPNHQYRSQLYRVSWNEGDVAGGLNGSRIFPDIALL